MNTQTLDQAQPNQQAPKKQHIPQAQMSGSNLARLIKAEFHKLFSLRSTWVLIGTSMLLMIGFAFLSVLSLELMKNALEADMSNGGSAQMDADPQMQALLAGEGIHAAMGGSGYQLALVLLGSIAVLAAAGEFNTGAIRSTLLANPKRWQVVTAKTLVITVVTGLTIFLGALISHYVIWPQLSEYDYAESFFAPDQWWQYMVMILFTIAASWLGLGLGFLLRNSAGAIVALLMIVMILPIVWMFLPGETMATIGGYLPSNLAGTAMGLTEPDEFPSRAAAIGLFMGWGLLGLAAGGTRFATTDVK